MTLTFFARHFQGNSFFSGNLLFSFSKKSSSEVPETGHSRKEGCLRREGWGGERGEEKNAQTENRPVRRLHVLGGESSIPYAPAVGAVMAALI